jgi:hypothetical protein
MQAKLKIMQAATKAPRKRPAPQKLCSDLQRLSAHLAHRHNSAMACNVSGLACTLFWSQQQRMELSKPLLAGPLAQLFAGLQGHLHDSWLACMAACTWLAKFSCSLTSFTLFTCRLGHGPLDEQFCKPGGLPFCHEEDHNHNQTGASSVAADGNAATTS